MNVEDIKKRYPDIDLEELSKHFPRMPMSDYPELSEYSWEDCHKGLLGASGLFLASDMARIMPVKEGMRILDLGAGHCLTSIFLAKRYKAKVIAADLRVDPSENWNRIKEAGVTDSVTTIKMDAHNIPFAKGYFDAVFCMNSHFYFGTGDLYLSYLVQFLRRDGRICIASPCYASELTSETPSEFLEEASVAYHSPGWWQHHFEKTELLNLLHCKEHPKGPELWLDMVRWLIEECHPFKGPITKSRFATFYECEEPAWEKSQKRYCIFHERRRNKDKTKFAEEVTRKVRQGDYDFKGYWFPTDTDTFESFTFRRNVSFEECTFEGRAHFEESTFEGKSSFIGSTFKGGADFGGECIFKGPTYFFDSIFEGYAEFTGSVFKENAFFKCGFKQGCTFRGCTFEKGASFMDSSFGDTANFVETKFGGISNFEGCTFEEGVNLEGSSFEQFILLDRLRIKRPSQVDILFRKAKTLWHREGNYVEEGKCHYQEMDYIRKQKRWDFRYIWTNLVHRLLHGYGEKPHRVILWAVAIVIACALLFMNFGIGETRLFVENLPTYNIFKILPKFYTLLWDDLANIGRYFYFSVVTFTTLGYGDLRPVHPISHLISSIEAFTGMFMMALFVLTFGRKWRR